MKIKTILILLSFPVFMILSYGWAILFLSSSDKLANYAPGKFRKNETEMLLRAKLPNYINDLQYFKTYYSEDYDIHDTYIKFLASESEYKNLINEMRKTFVESQEDLALVTIGDWKGPPAFRLKWWEPTFDNTKNTYVLKDDKESWILIKYEHGYVYIRER